MAEKKCNKCGTVKPLSDFYFTRGKPFHHCKPCHREQARQIRAQPGYNEYHRAYRKANRPRLLELAREYRKKHPEKSRAYTQKSRKVNPARALYNAAKARAKKYGIVFSLDFADVVMPDRCPVLGIAFGQNTGRGMGAFADSPSLDRIIPNLGYVPGNVQVVSRLANTMKSNATPEQLLAFSEWVRRKYG